MRRSPLTRNAPVFVMGEGAGILILEEFERAKARGAKIYGEIVGYGSTCDAHHITLPMEDGEGAAHAMMQALADGKVNPEQIGYINAHGTGTPPNDRIIDIRIGPAAKTVSISSTKSMTGHLLGATARWSQFFLF